MQFTNEYGTIIECDESLARSMGFWPMDDDSKPAPISTADDSVTETDDNSENDELTAADVPEGSSRVVLEWVGSNRDRARLALDVENAKDDPRSTLISQLENRLD